MKCNKLLPQGPGNGDTDPGKRRKMLRRYDHVAMQALSPFGESGIHKAEMATLLEMTNDGNRTAMFFSEFANPKIARKGIAISRLVQMLPIAFKHAQSDKMKMMVKEELMAMVE